MLCTCWTDLAQPTVYNPTNIGLTLKLRCFKMNRSPYVVTFSEKKKVSTKAVFSRKCSFFKKKRKKK